MNAYATMDRPGFSYIAPRPSIARTGSWSVPPLSRLSHCEGGKPKPRWNGLLKQYGVTPHGSSARISLL
jgi:hypothetical protein